MSGSLFLIPASLGEGTPEQVLPPLSLRQISHLDYFIVENEKSARSWLRGCGLEKPLQELTLVRFDEHSSKTEVQSLLAPAAQGRSIGLLSEAGVPCVADPGALVVRAAHEMGIKVTPLIGPSAILLALMASGLEGQRFQFVGYPPREDPARENFLRDCLRSSKAERQTVLMIETPYRGEKLFQAILRVGSAETEILIAEGVTMPSESIRTMRVEEWRRTEDPPLFAEPAVFGLYQPKPLTK